VGPRKAEILGGQDHPERAEVRPFFPPPFRTRGVRTHGPPAGMHRAHRVHSSVRSGQATVSGFGARLGAPLACKRYTSRPRSVVAPAHACPLAVRRCCCCIVVLLWALLAIRAPIRPPAVPSQIPRRGVHRDRDLAQDPRARPARPLALHPVLRLVRRRRLAVGACVRTVCFVTWFACLLVCSFVCLFVCLFVCFVALPRFDFRNHVCMM
jgi:hypothetical protein